MLWLNSVAWIYIYLHRHNIVIFDPKYSAAFKKSAVYLALLFAILFGLKNTLCAPGYILALLMGAFKFGVIYVGLFLLLQKMRVIDINHYKF